MTIIGRTLKEDTMVSIQEIQQHIDSMNQRIKVINKSVANGTADAQMKSELLNKAKAVKAWEDKLRSMNK